MLDEWIKVSSGIMPGTLQHLTAVDRSKSLVTNSIQFKKQQAEEIKRRNKFHVMAYMRSQESLAEAHAESGDNESAMRIATSAIEYGYENGLNTSDISPGMWNFSGLRRTANKAILDRLKRVQEVASKEQDIIAKEAQEREDVNGLVSQILSQNPSLDGRYDELSSTQKNSAVNRVIAMSMYGEAAQDEYLSKKGIKDLKEGRLLIDFDRTANSLITMLGYGYDDQGRNTSHRIATGQEQNILQFRRAFESNNMDPSAVAVSLSLFNALEDKDMGNLVQSEIFGADGVEKIRRYNTALSLPSNEGREREIFMETFGFSSVPNFPISRDHLEWGERKASDEANGLFKAWPGGEVPTEKEDQEFIAQIYAQSLATAEALSGFSTDKRRIEVQAEALARRRYTNINGGIILYHNELGGITHDEILKESGVHMHVESPIGREFQYAALNSLIDERVLDLEPSRFSGWDYANMALNPFAWGLRAEAVKHGLSVRRTHDLVSNQDGTYSILSVTMIDDGQGGDVPITVHIGMDEYIQKIEDLQREYDSDRRRTNQGGEFKSAPAFQRKL